MMEAKLMKAYEMLVPADQLVVDAMVVTLANKDKQIRDLVAHVHRELDKKKCGACGDTGEILNGLCCDCYKNRQQKQA